MGKEHVVVKKGRIDERDITEYILDRFQQVKKSKNISNLVEFQAKNKYLIMVHSQEKLCVLGNLVANHKKERFESIIEEYEKHLRSALSIKPTTSTHLNVIMHFFGYFAKRFTNAEKDLFIEIIRQFKEERVGIGKVLAEIEPLIYIFNNTYLASQTYFLLYADSSHGFSFSNSCSTNPLFNKYERSVL